MKIIGCDFHPGYQQVVMWDKETGEVTEKALQHERKEEVRAFYAGRALAKVAMARKLAVRLYWMLRSEVDYAQLLQGSHAGQLESSRGRG